MAWPNSQARRVALTIPAAQFVGPLSSFPVLITAASLTDGGSLDDEILDSAGGGTACQSDGGDLRFASDADGNTQLPFEVVNFTKNATPANADVEIWVKVDLAENAGAGTVIYMAWDTTGTTTLPVATDSNGRNAVWSGYQCVLHLNEDPTDTAPQFVDSTGAGNDLTANGSMTAGDLVSASWGKGIDFDGVNDYLSKTSPSGVDGVGPYSITAWVEANDASGYMSVASRGGVFESDTLFDFGVRRAGGPIARVYNYWRASSTLYGAEKNIDGGASYSGHNHIASVVDSGYDLENFVDGSSIGTDTSNSVGVDGSDALQVGKWSGTQTSSEYMDGIIAEVRIYDGELSSDWIAAEHNNQDAPATFISEGTPENVGGAPAGQPTMRRWGGIPGMQYTGRGAW